MPHRLIAFLLVWITFTGGALANADLARAKNCLSCHKVDGQLVGPAYRAIAARYANDSNAETKLAANIRAGGNGRWGVITMPPQPQVSEAEARALARWILDMRP